MKDYSVTELFLNITELFILNILHRFLIMKDYSVTELDLSNQRLIKLPDDIHLYTRLVKLDCHN
jgi:Leucine-rich repeat (LRR) protein